MFQRQSSPDICVSRCVTGRLEHQRRRCRDEEESAVRISAGLLQLQRLQVQNQSPKKKLPIPGDNPIK